MKELEDQIQECLVLPFRDSIRQYGDPFLQRIWTSPGFSSYFLNEDLMLSPIMKLRRDKGMEAIQPNDTPEFMKSVGYTLIPPYGQFMTILFTATAFRFEPGNPSPLIQENGLAAAIVRTLMTFWSSWHVRAGSPNIEQIENLYFMMFKLTWMGSPLKQWTKPSELIPGLTAKQLLWNILVDEAFLRIMPDHELEGFLESIYCLGADHENDKKHPWSWLTLNDRIDLLDLAHDWTAPKKKMSKKFEFFTNVRTSVLHLITGTTTSTLLKMHDYAIKRKPPPDERTILMIKKIRNAMIVKYKPKVTAYLDIVEPKYREHAEQNSQQVMPFPEVLVPVIAEFAFEKRYFWASSKRKGLNFLTPKEELEFQEQVTKSLFDSMHLRQGYNSTGIRNAQGHLGPEGELTGFAMVLIRAFAMRFVDSQMRPVLGGVDSDKWNNAFPRPGAKERVQSTVMRYCVEYMGHCRDPHHEELVKSVSEADIVQNLRSSNPEPFFVDMKEELHRYLWEFEQFEIVE